MNLYPVNLNIEGQKCLVVGGGAVALRKVKELLFCNAEVVVISPAIEEDISSFAEQGLIKWMTKEYEEGDLEGGFLVFAATDSREVQSRIAEEAVQRNILMNSADDPAESSFHVPARVRRGDFLLTVSTGGGSPALAAKLRKKLELEFGEEYQYYVKLLGQIREQVVGDGASQEVHRALFRKLLQPNILQLIREKDWTSLQNELRACLPEGTDIRPLIEPIRMQRMQDECGSAGETFEDRANNHNMTDEQ